MTGRVGWKSSPNIKAEIGEFAWENSYPEDEEEVKAIIAKTAMLRESHVREYRNNDGELFRVWLWPLNTPDAAVCVLGMRIPSELSELTDREMDCLRLLAHGKSTKLLASELEISLSTVHTHLKRMRTKLKLESTDELISFAARFCHTSFGSGQVPENKNVQ